MSSFFEQCYPRTPDGIVNVIPLSSEEMHPRLQPQRQQMIFPLMDIIESVDHRLANDWADKRTATCNGILNAAAHAMIIWCKHGWKILSEIHDKTPAEAHAMVTEFFNSEYRLQDQFNALSLKITLTFIPMMVTVYKENGNFLDTLQFVKDDKGQPVIHGDDIIIEATYIKAY